MKNKTLEIIISTVIFSLLNVVYFLFNFSKWGAIPLVLTLGYYFLRINNKGKDGYTLSEWIGVYFGALLVDMFLIKACYSSIIPSKPVLPSTNSMTWAIILLIAEVIVLLNLNKHIDLKYGIAVFLKYAILYGVTIGCSYIFIKWNDAKIVFALFPILFFTLLFELFINKYNRSHCFSIFRWTMSLCVLFNLTNCLYPDYSISMVKWISNISLNLHFKWYVAIILLTLFAFGIGATVVLRQKNKSKASDTQVFLMLFFTTLFFWVTSSLVTKYNFVFIVLFFIANAIYLTFNLKSKNMNAFGVLLSTNNIQYSIVLAILIGLPIAFYYGTIIQYFILASISLFIIFQYSTFKTKGDEEEEEDEYINKQNRPHNKWFFWQVILSMFAIYAIVVTTIRCRYVWNYIFIGIVYALATGAFYIINIQNSLKPKNHCIMRMVISFPVILIFLFSINQSSINTIYKIDNAISVSENVSQDKVQESGTISLKVDVKNEKAKITKAYYYWSQDKENIVEVKLGEEQQNTIELRNDCLCFVCESESGMIYTDRHWFFNRMLGEYDEVGYARSFVNSETPENADQPEQTEPVSDPSTNG